MFNAKLIKQMQKEIEYLRVKLEDLNLKNEELLNRYMSLNEKSLWQFKQAVGKPVDNEAPRGLNVMGFIDSMPADSEQDKKDRELAKEQLMDTLS